MKRAAWNAKFLLTVAGLFALSGCDAMRVSGFVTDAITGEPIQACGVMIQDGYTHVDTAGHYSIRAELYGSKKLSFIAGGYEEETVVVDASKTRYPKLDVQLQPKQRKPCECPEAKPDQPRID
jgi:hypothetical protein